MSTIIFIFFCCYSTSALLILYYYCCCHVALFPQTHLILIISIPYLSPLALGASARTGPGRGYHTLFHQSIYMNTSLFTPIPPPSFNISWLIYPLPLSSILSHFFTKLIPRQPFPHKRPSESKFKPLRAIS